MNSSVPIEALLLATLAGISIPLGATLARWEHFIPNWLDLELRHSVLAFGGGAWIGAVALVLVPEGASKVGPLVALASFLGGGVIFMALDRAITSSFGQAGQVMAMLLDFVPEAIALGAMFAAEPALAVFLALLIAMQNLPEAFNAYNELADGVEKPKKLLRWFWLLVLLGPASVALGHLFFAPYQGLLGVLMLFAGGGILYLIFQDVAPKVPVKNHWAPPLWAVLGFLLALVGDIYLH